LKNYQFAFFICCIILSFDLEAQIGFSDDFTDSNFTTNPAWSGEVSKFVVNQTKQLQLSDVGGSSPAYIITTSKVVNDASWQFSFELGFDPSGSNYAKVYLIADRQNLTQSLDGYFVRIGGQSNTVDNVRLYRQDGTKETLLINGISGTVASSPRGRIKVLKDPSNEWQMWLDTSQQFNNPILQGSAIDGTHSQSEYFGLTCIYTSTRSDKFFFDDFVVAGTAFQDTVRPRVDSWNVVNDTTIDLRFSENLDALSVSNTANYIVNKGVGNPSLANIVMGDSSLVRLGFSTRFVNGEDYDLVLQDVEDRNSNQLLKDTLSFFYFVPDTPSKREVVINELYPDESPSFGLPGSEFIELFNASNKIFDLAGWSISDGTTTAYLSTYILRPDSFVILCPSSALQDYSSYGNVLGQNSFPSLNNSGDKVSLKDNLGVVIDELNYTTTWYKEDAKKDGGYTLEQINPYTDCSGESNFSASLSPIGGTPGTRNTLYSTQVDTSPPMLIGTNILSPDSIVLLFNEVLDTLSVYTASYLFNTTAATGSSLNIEPSFTSVLLLLSIPLDSGVINTLRVSKLADCSGNSIQSTELTITLPLQAKKGDIVINEILFNPKSGGSDFVELYNRSDKILSLKAWSMGNGKEGLPDAIEEITAQSLILYPKEYLGLTENVDAVAEFYAATRRDRFVEVADLPSYNDDEGVVFLINEKGKIIDEVAYSEKQHFALLNDNEGVSLERINPNRPSEDKSNFHSAAEAVGFATPGYENSQFFNEVKHHGVITIDPETFSPDNDGYNDVVNINYRFDTPGYVANVSIFDRNGRRVKKLINNELLAREGSFTWDGVTDENTKGRIGIYVVYFEAYHPDGDKKVFREAVVLAGFLD
jgi:hypothetical protein